MKKLSTLFLLILSFLSKPTTAQNITCNAEFNVTYINGNTVQFIPVMPGDPGNTQHYWIFGDGAVDNLVSPQHTYLASGAYTAKHIIIRFSGGVVICRDSFYRVIQIQSPTSCNLVANFTTTPISPNAFHFENTSVPLHSTDSIRWSFGDGTSSNDVSPNHTFLQPGTYNVCLRIQQREPNGTLTNCIREICHTVIVQNSTACNLVANFTSTFVVTAPASYTYYFQNTSTPFNLTDSVRWTFGDGTSSNQGNPVHTYTQPGTYTVCLRVQQREPNGTLTNCIREICHTLIVQNPTTCNLVANFYSYRDTTVANTLTYHFENTSVPLSNTDSIRWTFGDGTSSNQVSPNHTYTQPGTYTVCLRVQKRTNTGTLTNCISEICHAIIVQNPTTCNLVASFSITPVTATPNAFHFVNTSTPLNITDSIRWTFGDGTSSNDVNPTHTYLQPGTYTICLRIQQRNPNGTLTNCVRETCHTITVQGPNTCNLVASFIPTIIATAPFTFHFENTSTPLGATDSIRWTFGDGTSSNQVSPNHTYTQPGTYNVCLRVIKRTSAGTLSNCVGEICHTVNVPSTTTCNLVANFIIAPVTASPNTFHFVNTSTPLNATDSIRWTFGDGSSSNIANPNHTYLQPGTYNVCLRVQQRNPNGTLTNCVREICHTVYVQGPNTCNLFANFYSYRVYVAGTALPYLYHFVNTTGGLAPTDSIRWTFGDGTTSNQVSPNHAYTQPGTYHVCLRVIKRTSTGTLSNCISEICHTLVVVALSPNSCNLQPYPNPAGNSVSVNVFLGIPQMIDVYVYNTSNIQVKEKHQQGVTGNNIVTLNTNDLLPGIYIMKVIHGNDVCYTTFLKL